MAIVRSSTVMDLVTQGLRPPATLVPDGSGSWTATFEPPLTAPEQAQLADILLMAQFGITSNITLAEFQAIKLALGDARTFRLQSDAAFSALTAAQRDAALRTTVFDLIDVIRALLRS